MTSSDLSIRLSAEDAGAAQTIKEVAREEIEAIKGVERFSRATERASKMTREELTRQASQLREHNQQMSRAQRVVRSFQTDNEKLADKLRDLKAARDSQEISEDRYRETVRRLIATERDRREAVAKSEAVIADRERVLRRANRTETEYAAIEKRLAPLIRQTETAQEAYNRDVEAAVVARKAGTLSEREYQRALDNAKAKLNETRKVQDETFGSKTTAAIGKHFAAFVTGASAIAVVRRALEFYKRELDEATGSTDSLSDARRALTQVANGAEDLAGLERRADLISAREGISRTESREFLFNARSVGFEDEADQVAARSQVIGLDALGTLAGTTTNLFGGELTSVETVEGVFAGAKASAANTEDVARVLPTLAVGGAELGSSAIEQIASLSVLTEKFKSPEQAAERIAALQSQVNLYGEEAGIDNRSGLLEAVKQIQQLTPEERKDFLGGSREVNDAFSAFSKKVEATEDRMVFVQGAVNLAYSDDAMTMKAREAKFANTESGAIQRAQLARNIAQVEEEISNERANSVSGFEIEASSDRVARRLREQGSSALGRDVGSWAARGLGYIGWDEQTAQDTGEFYGGLLSPFSGGRKGGGGFGRSGRSNESVDRNTEAINNLTRSLQPSGTAPGSSPGEDR